MVPQQLTNLKNLDKKKLKKVKDEAKVEEAAVHADDSGEKFRSKKNVDLDNQINEKIISKQKIKPDEMAKHAFKTAFPPNVLSKEAIKMIQRDLEIRENKKTNEKTNQGA